MCRKGRFLAMSGIEGGVSAPRPDSEDHDLEEVAPR